METPTGHRPLLSVVVPVYCEQEIVPEFYRRTKEVLAGLANKCEHEIVFVNDGSTDSSWEALKGLRERDEHVKLLSFSRNFGHQIAITAGMDHAAGDAVVIIDSDLQDPPEVIPQMLAKWEEGYKVVYGQRARRKGETAFKLLTAKAFYRLLERLSEVRIPLDTGDFRLVDKAVIRTLQTMREGNRYVRGLVAWTGFPSTGVTYERDARYAGETKYSLRKMAKFALDGITSFSDKPLQLSSLLGGLVALSAVLVILWAVARELLFPETTIEGWALVLAAVLFLGGLQLLSLGVLGQYIGRICREVRQRPLYVLSEKLGFGDDPGAMSHGQRRTSG